MNKVKVTVAVIGVAIASYGGHLTAQPNPVKPPPKFVLTAKQQQFLGDLNVAIRQNHDIKVARMLADAAGDAELSNVIVEKLWNYQDRPEVQDEKVAATLEKTFAIQQRQREIELQTQILAELKKNAG